MTEPEPPGRGHVLLVAGAVALVFGLYLPFLGAPFEYDDKVEILLNQVIRHPGNVGEMVAYNPFRVLLLYTFAADVWAWGSWHPSPIDSRTSRSTPSTPRCSRGSSEAPAG
jgi:hypothetical protein